MSTTSEMSVRDPSRSASGNAARSRERLFFGGMAVALAVVVFWGFAPT
jgi:hypothetical protein